jgi:hypothetical protein
MESSRLKPVASARRGRSLAVATAIVFVISSIFPVVAGLSKNTEAFPRLWGILDVVIAFLLATLAIVTMALFERAVNEEINQVVYRAYRVLIHAILVFCVVFQLAGDRIVWINCLPGFAWRAWLLFFALPAWLAAFRNNSLRLPLTASHDQK